MATQLPPAAELVELLRADDFPLAGDLGVTSNDISNEDVSNGSDGIANSDHAASPTAAVHALTASPTVDPKSSTNVSSGSALKDSTNDGDVNSGRVPTSSTNISSETARAACTERV